MKTKLNSLIKVALDINTLRLAAKKSFKEILLLKHYAKINPTNAIKNKLAKRIRQNETFNLGINSIITGKKPNILKNIKGYKEKYLPLEWKPNMEKKYKTLKGTTWKRGRTSSGSGDSMLIGNI